MCTLLVHSAIQPVSFHDRYSIMLGGGNTGGLLLQITMELWLDENDAVQKLPKYLVFMSVICVCDGA